MIPDAAFGKFMTKEVLFHFVYGYLAKEQG